MKSLLFLLGLFISTQFTGATLPAAYNKTAVKQQVEAVYICNSKSAYAYHASRSCKGLNRCKSTILEINKKKAAENGRSPCKICY